MRPTTMKFLSLFLALFMTTAFAVDDGNSGLKQQDIEALRDWIKTKRQVTVKEGGGNLSISGDIRSELQSTSEKMNGIKQRGSGGQTDSPTRDWDVTVNLILDYRTDRTLAMIKLALDNDAGSESGTSNKISLGRAFLGGRIVDADTYAMKLEIGRRPLGYTFDSKVMFGSRMDGILYRYDRFDRFGDFYLQGGPFLIDNKLDRYAYVGELGLLNIGRIGLYSKLSAVCWDTKHGADEVRNNAFRFIPIQILLGYKGRVLDKTLTLYGAGLYNPRARGTEVSYGKSQPWAWYTGFSLGKVRKQWDWSLEVNYQWVQLQAIPDFDGSGIGRGNARGIGLYSTKTYGKGDPLTKGEGVGAGNYKGIAIELLYLLTDNITVYQAWRQSVNQNPSIKPTFSYKQYEFEVIYGF
ncbi:MAG: hypothetical protein AAGE99_03760 [Chlamydiota bacterium]